MEPTKISLKALELFLTVARLGTLREAALDLGISISTASHHLTELEKAIGTDLFDHARRPMALTPAGEIMRKRADEALGSLRKGLSEIWSDEAQTLVRLLRLAIIEDFDADVAPALTRALIDGAPNCDISLLSRPTHEIVTQLENRKIDIGIAATTDFDGSGITEVPILRDPFVLVLPEAITAAPETVQDLLALAEDIPLLRYNDSQLLGQRIEAQLRRLDARFPRRMAFETTHVILSLVAAGRGWTVTTALSCARAQRYHADLRILRFPGKAFARDISLFARDDVPDSVTRLVTASLRQSISDMVIGPTVIRYPWLADQLRLLGQDPVAPSPPNQPIGSETEI